MLSVVRLAVVSAFVSFVAAANVITSVVAGTSLTPGQPFTITWTPDSSSTVTLILRKGQASNLDNIGAIATVQNTGSYTWYPDAALPGGSDYALEIVGTDGVPSYSHYFTINDQSVTASSSRLTTSASRSTDSSRSSVKTTTLPESLVTDSLISSASRNSSVSSSMSSRSSASSASSSSSAKSSGSSASASRSASHSVASATTSASSATALVKGVIEGAGFVPFLLLSLASMVFCMI